jgi:hypothetical protein
MTTRVPASMIATSGATLEAAHPCDATYGAVGDGATSDTAAFAAFEAAVTGKRVDLGGSHKNRLWVMGYQATITEERETLLSGRWTPTATLGTNVAAAVPGSAHYIRVGNIVHFAGRITIDPTATGFCTLELSLPIASNFSSLTDASGVFNALGVTGVATTVDTGAIEGSVANDRLVLSFITTDTANRAYYYCGSYEVK